MTCVLMSSLYKHASAQAVCPQVQEALLQGQPDSGQQSLVLLTVPFFTCYPTSDIACGWSWSWKQSETELLT